MPTYQARDPLARANTLRSIPFIRPAAQVMGHSDQAKAAFILDRAREAIPTLEQRVAYYCTTLGQANRMKGAMRRHWQATAFRNINSARAQLRQARREVAAAEAAMLAFVPAVAA